MRASRLGRGLAQVGDRGRWMSPRAGLGLRRDTVFPCDLTLRQSAALSARAAGMKLQGLRAARPGRRGMRELVRSSSVCCSSRGRRAQQEPLELPSPGPHTAVAPCVRVLTSCYKDPSQGQPGDLTLATSPPHTVTFGGPAGLAPTYLFGGHDSTYKSSCAILWTDVA